jgi:hypothetical protein
MTTREMHVRVMTLVSQINHPELMGMLPAGCACARPLWLCMTA